MVGMSALKKEKKEKEKILPYKDLFTLIFLVYDVLMLMTVLNLGKFLAMTRSRSDTYLRVT